MNVAFPSGFLTVRALSSLWGLLLVQKPKVLLDIMCILH
jgi:hypothetical protein